MFVWQFPLHRGVEQLVARRAHNPKVEGSSPSPATIYGGIAQLARAFGSYPECHLFESDCRYHNKEQVMTVCSLLLVILFIKDSGCSKGFGKLHVRGVNPHGYRFEQCCHYQLQGFCRNF